MPHTVLIVDSNPAALSDTASAFRDAGYHVTTTASFESAKWRLRTVPPDLLVTDVRLGDYNGIHLVIRGRTDDAGLQAIVTDTTRDRVLEADATTQGAIYLVKPFEAEKLVDVARELVERRPERASTKVPRSSPRHLIIPPIGARLGADEGFVLDASYDGARLDLEEVTDDTMRARAPELVLSSGVRISVRPVWARRSPAGGRWWIGVELDAVSAEDRAAWRGFVDSIRC
jgi:DNA-binding response OmpR family regulator